MIMFLRKQIKMKQMLTNIGMGILLTACGNGGMDPVDTGGEEEYVPVRVETVTDNGIGTRAGTLSNAAIGIFRTAPYSATFPQQYDVECIHDGTAWRLASKIYVGSTDASLHAYYPYGKVTFGANSTVTALTVKDHTADNDFCYADAPLTAVNNRTPVASFLLKHFMWNVAWISVNPLRMRDSWEGVPLPVGVWIHLRLLWGQRVSPEEVRMRVSANCFLHKILRMIPG